MSTASRLRRECLRHAAVRCHERREFAEPFLAVDVKNNNSVSRSEGNVGIRVFCPPSADRRFVVSCIFKSFLAAGVLAWRKAIDFATRARAVDNRVTREDSPAHSRVCERGFKFGIHVMGPLPHGSGDAIKGQALPPGAGFGWTPSLSQRLGVFLCPGGPSSPPVAVSSSEIYRGAIFLFPPLSLAESLYPLYRHKGKSHALLAASSDGVLHGV